MGRSKEEEEEKESEEEENNKKKRRRLSAPVPPPLKRRRRAHCEIVSGVPQKKISKFTLLVFKNNNNNIQLWSGCASKGL